QRSRKVRQLYAIGSRSHRSHLTVFAYQLRGISLPTARESGNTRSDTVLVDNTRSRVWAQDRGSGQRVNRNIPTVGGRDNIRNGKPPMLFAELHRHLEVRSAANRNDVVYLLAVDKVAYVIQRLLLTVLYACNGIYRQAVGNV